MDELRAIADHIDAEHPRLRVGYCGGKDLIIRMRTNNAWCDRATLLESKLCFFNSEQDVDLNDPTSFAQIDKILTGLANYDYEFATKDTSHG